MSLIKIYYVDHPFHYNIAKIRQVYQMEQEFLPYVKPVFIRKWTNKPVLIVFDGKKYYKYKGESINHLRSLIWFILKRKKKN